MTRTLIPLSMAIAGALIVASPASAATVTNCEGLQPALSDENNSVVTIAEGLTCEGDFYLPSRPITLEGAGKGATLSGDEEVRERILYGHDVGKTVIRNLRFVHGSDDEDGDGGGAILVEGDSPITVEGSTFEDNSAEGDGGAILVNPNACCQENVERTRGDETPQAVTIADSTFGGDGLENSSDGYGGAVAAYGYAIDVIGSKFVGNTAESGGGGLSALSFGRITLAGNEFTGNASGDHGGGAEISSCDDLTVRDNVFAENTVEPSGSQDGTQLEGGGLWADGCSFLARTAALGGKGGAGTLEQSGNTFRANVLEVETESLGEGAGEFVNSLTLLSTDDTYHANEIEGAGIGRGGGLRYEDGDGAVLRNLVATANTMPAGDGGGVAFDADGATLEVAHATITANAIGEGQGAAISGGDGQSLFMANSIVHGNTGGPEIAGFAPFETLNGAARQGVQSSGIELAFTLACDGTAAYAGDGNLCADPKLADAAGGDVHQTAASPTHEKASADLTSGLEADFEGDARALDYDRSSKAEPDMGADEAPAPALPQPPQQQPQQPSTGGVLGTQSQSCASRRSFRIKLRTRGQKVVKATVLVNGKRVKVLRGKRLTSRVNLRGLPKGRFTVKIKLRLANGKVISGTRRYRTCTPGRPSGPPPV